MNLIRVKVFILYVSVFCSSSIPLVSQEVTWKEHKGSPYSINALIAATGATIYAQLNNGILYSTNNGTAWTNIEIPSSIQTINAMAVSAKGYLYIAANTGMFRTKTKGHTWEHISYLPFSAVGINSKGTIYGGTINGKLFCSTDKGENWNNINFTLSTALITSFAFKSAKNYFLATSGNGVFQTQDSGKHWRNINTGLTNTNITTLFTANDGSLLAATYGDGVFRYLPQTSSWENMGLKYKLPMAFTYRQNGDLLTATLDGGILDYHSDSLRFKRFNAGIDNIIIPALAKAPDGTIFSGTSDGSIYRSIKGMYWRKVNAPLSQSYVCCLGINSKGDIFAGTYGSGVMRSTNEGKTWMQINNGLNNSFVRSLVITSTDTLCIGTNNGAYTSCNNGGMWNYVSTTEKEHCIYSLSLSPANQIAAVGKGTLFSLSQNMLSWNSLENPAGAFFPRGLILAYDTTILASLYNHGVFLSTAPPGQPVEKWSFISTLGRGLYFTNAVAALQHIVYAATNSNTIIYSNDNFEQWKEIRTFVNRARILSLSVNGNCIFAGTEGDGLWYSTNQGNTWRQSTSGFPYAVVSSMVADGNNTLFMGTNKGVFSVPLIQLNALQDSVTNSGGYSLAQNIPNPFNPSTYISFTLRLAGNVTIKVYNVLGEEVETLLDNKYLESGKHQTVFDASQLPSGVYFYSISTPRFQEMKKMVLVK